MRSKFAFLMHPRNTVRSDMGLLLGAPFALVPDRVYLEAFRRFPVKPVLTGRMTYRDTPAETTGLIYTVPFTPDQLLGLPRQKVRARINLALDMARDAGATVIGLGALTAPVCNGGKALVERDDIGITNGNAYTAAMTLQGIERLLLRLPSDPLVAFVGASGSVGSCLSKLYARKHGGRVLLVARNRGRLEKLAGEIARDDLEVTVSTEMDDVREADLIVLLTSATEALLRSEHLKHGAVVLDDTVPRNTDIRLLAERPDVTIVDGGLVEIPGVDLKGTIGLPPNLAYACLAETMLLALEGHTGHFAIGNASVDQALRMLELAEKHREHGFNLAPFRSFGRLLDTGSAETSDAEGEGARSWAA